MEGHGKRCCLHPGSQRGLPGRFKWATKGNFPPKVVTIPCLGGCSLRLAQGSQPGAPQSPVCVSAVAGVLQMSAVQGPSPCSSQETR